MTPAAASALWIASSLLNFAASYGIDWSVTVLPIVKLANLNFGERDAAIVFA